MLCVWWKIPGLSFAMNSSAASHVRKGASQSWKRDFGEVGSEALKTVTPTGGPVVTR